MGDTSNANKLPIAVHHTCITNSAAKTNLTGLIYLNLDFQILIGLDFLLYWNLNLLLSHKQYTSILLLKYCK